MDEDHPFIVVEGLDRAGKSSAIEYAAENVDFYSTAEPTGTRIGDSAKAATEPTVAALTMMADRQIHNRDIVSALRHRPVVCDRYKDSTLAYQGPYLRDTEWFEPLVAHTSLVPDHTIYIDISAETAKDRGAEEYVDDLEFAREQYNKMYHTYVNGDVLPHQNVTIIDGEQDHATVKEEVLSAIEDHV